MTAERYTALRLLQEGREAFRSSSPTFSLDIKTELEVLNGNSDADMSIEYRVEKINTRSNTRRMVNEAIAIETPVNLFLNDEYVITLLATPDLQKELALGWFFDEGVLDSIDQITQINVDHENINVTTKQVIPEEKIRVVSVSRLLTTACGLSAKQFVTIMSDIGQKPVESEYAVTADTIISMVNQLNESRLFRLTGGVHVAALFENERLVAFAEDVGRHNTVDKVVGLGIQSDVNFSNSVIVSSGRQPADMILKAARMGIPIAVSKAAPIRSGIIAAEKTGITLACFVREYKMNIYTYHNRILLN